MALSTYRVVWFASLLVIACDTVSEEPVQKPANPVAPVPVVVVMVLAPTPTPAPPAPAPPDPAPPAAQGCRLPPGNGSGHDCPREQPSFLAEVESAMDQLARDEPGLFDLRRARGCSNCYFVKDPTRYTQRMAQLMDQRGLCGHYDGEELAVKNSNAFNDQYDILTSDMFIRRQGGSYRSTCYPAWF